MTVSQSQLPWYRRPARVPLWFVLVALLGWGLHLYRGVFPADRTGLYCAPVATRNPYRDSSTPPMYVRGPTP
jgi:hypothetical protein